MYYLLETSFIRLTQHLVTQEGLFLTANKDFIKVIK